MQIVELGDCSMVIMKDSEDPPWVSVGDIYRKAVKCQGCIFVEAASETYNDSAYQFSYDYIYSGGRLILFFKNDVDSRFSVHDKVNLKVYCARRSRRH